MDIKTQIRATTVGYSKDGWIAREEASNNRCAKDTEQTDKNPGKEKNQQQDQSENNFEVPRHVVSKPDSGTDKVGRNADLRYVGKLL